MISNIEKKGEAELEKLGLSGKLTKNQYGKQAEMLQKYVQDILPSAMLQYNAEHG
jgi:hypothetical protein